jgi:hypothetical protein
MLELEKNGTKQYENLPPIEESNCDTRDKGPPPRPIVPETFPSDGKPPAFLCSHPITIPSNEIEEPLVEFKVNVSKLRSPCESDEFFER